MKRRTWSAGEAGFTLLEILLTLIILAVVLGLVLPDMGNWADGWRNREAASLLKRAVMEARVAAMRAKSAVEISYHPQGMVLNLGNGALGLGEHLDDFAITDRPLGRQRRSWFRVYPDGSADPVWFLLTAGKATAVYRLDPATCRLEEVK